MGYVIKLKNKIAIIGPYPLPYGGISVHVQRVVAQLENKKNIEFDFYNETRNSFYKQACYNFSSNAGKFISLLRLLFYPYCLIHHHSPDLNIRIVLSLFGFLGKNIYLHIHGASLKDSLDSGIRGKLLKKLLKYVHILADNNEIGRLAKENEAKTVTILDAFIPPVYNETYFMEFNNKYKFITTNYDLVIGMVGWFAYYNREDLYGFDLLIKAVRILKHKYKISIIVSVNGIIEKKLHDEFIRDIKKYNLEDNFCLIYENLQEIWPIYIISDVFIRPTNTDGNAISVKEALWFETPVICSDCIDRPLGTILFRNRDAKSLAQKIEQMILKNDSYTWPQKVKKIKNKNFLNRLFKEIYHVE